MLVRALEESVRDICGFIKFMVGIFLRELRYFDLGWIRKVLSLLRIVQMIRGWIRIRLGIGKWMAFNEGG